MPDPTFRNSLRCGYRLHWYEIEDILGKGAFGITYLARDTNLNQSVAIKEHLPVELAVRDRDYSVHPVSESHREQYARGLERFIREARTLAMFDHPNIVRVLAVFEQNHTAYMIMRYEQGESLRAVLKRRKTMEEDELLNLVMPILDGLEKVHDSGFLHRDIKPSNIFIREDGSPVLLDFGSAREAIGDDTKTLTSLVSPGYAPFEQYYSKSDQQGPWTDIYGLGATLYRATAGHQPMDAVDRSKAILKHQPDVLTPMTEIGAGRYRMRFLKAIDHALRFMEEERPQSIAQWKAELLTGADDVGTVPAPPVEHPTQPASPLPDANNTTASIQAPVRKLTAGLWYLVAAMVGAFALALTWHYQDPVGGRPPGTASVGDAQRSSRPASGGYPLSPDTAFPQNAVKEAQASARAPGPPPATAAARAEPGSVKLDQSRVKELLARARMDMDDERITAPPGGNALEKLQAALTLDPNNPEARRATLGITEILLARARQAATRGEYNGALEQLDRAKGSLPNQVQLALVKEQGQTAEAAATEAGTPPERQVPMEAVKPGSTFRDALEAGGSGPEMVVIPAGSFRMGDLQGVGAESEQPVVTVHIDKGFALGTHEVSVGEFRRFTSAAGNRTEAGTGGGCYVFNDKWERQPGSSWRGPGSKEGKDQPVVCVSHHDALAYAEWLGRQTGRSYRLPSEAEWEYAARAGTTTSYFWGEDADAACTFANVADLTAKQRYANWTTYNCRDGYVQTAPVGSFKPNPFGLFDVLGNVWEWTMDCWDPNHVAAPMNGSPSISGSCGERVVRGGSWFHFPSDVRSSFRFKSPADRRDVTLGFRIARDLS